MANRHPFLVLAGRTAGGVNLPILVDSSGKVVLSGGGSIGGSTGATDNSVLRADGVGGATLQNSALVIDDSGNATGLISLGMGATAGSAADVFLYRDAAQILSQRNGANNQFYDLYAAYTDASNYSRLRTGIESHNAVGFIEQIAGSGTASAGLWFQTADANGTHTWRLSTNYAMILRASDLEPGGDNSIDLGTPVGSSARWKNMYAGTSYTLQAANAQIFAVKQATVALTTNSGGVTATATNLIPAGCVVLGLDSRVTTVLAGAALTTFQIGDGTTTNLFANTAAIAATSTTDLTKHLATFKPTLYTAATSVVLTANAGIFSSGVIRLTVHYYTITAATS